MPSAISPPLTLNLLWNSEVCCPPGPLRQAPGKLLRNTYGTEFHGIEFFFFFFYAAICNLGFRNVLGCENFAAFRRAD